MARRSGSNGTFMIGALLLAAGIAGAAYGYYLYDGASGNVVSAIGKKLTGKASEAEIRAVAIMIAGGAAALFGFFLAFIRRSR